MLYGGHVTNVNGVPVPVCSACWAGKHDTVFGRSHFTGAEDHEDCKEVFTLPNGTVAQCCCGMGGDKLEGPNVH